MALKLSLQEFINLIESSSQNSHCPPEFQWKQPGTMTNFQLHVLRKNCASGISKSIQWIRDCTWTDPLISPCDIHIFSIFPPWWNPPSPVPFGMPCSQHQLMPEASLLQKTHCTLEGSSIWVLQYQSLAPNTQKQQHIRHQLDFYRHLIQGIQISRASEWNVKWE